MNNKNKLKINTLWYSSGVFIAGFDHSQHISIVFLLLAFNKYLTVGCETSHNVLKTPKAIYLFGNKSCKAYFILRFIIAPNWNKLWPNDHNMNMLWTYFSFALRNPKLIIIVSSHYLICSIIAISQRFNLSWCIKPKTYLNHWNSETNK